MTASRFSLAPLGEPGRVRMRVELRTPATGRDIAATIGSQVSVHAVGC